MTTRFGLSGCIMQLRALEHDRLAHRGGQKRWLGEEDSNPR